MNKKTMLIVFSPLAGCGKSVLAKALSDKLGRTYISIDPQDGVANCNHENAVVVDCPSDFEVLFKVMVDCPTHIVFLVKKSRQIFTFEDALHLARQMDKLFSVDTLNKVTLVLSKTIWPWTSKEIDILNEFNFDRTSLCEQAIGIDVKEDNGSLTNPMLLDQIIGKLM